MPTINLSGTSPTPRNNKDAAFAAYERSQAVAAEKIAQTDAAYGQVAAKRASEMEALWKMQAAQQKAQLDADKRIFGQEMAARTAALNAEKARDAEKKRQDGIRRQADAAEQKNYNGMRKRADADNQDFNRKQQFARNQWQAMRREANEENKEFNLRKKVREREEAALRRADPNTYRAENVSRLGLIGMRAAEHNDWRGLHNVRWSHLLGQPGGLVKLIRSPDHAANPSACWFWA